MGTRAAVYIRQSQTSEGTISPKLQREHVEAFIKAQGWEQTAEIYEDIDYSGRDEANRPAFLRLKDDYAAGKFDIAVADEYTRFSRNASQGIALLGDMQIATWKEGIPDPDDDFLPSFHFLLAAKFSKEISKRWKDAHRMRAEAKLPPQGHNKFGYVKTKEGYEPDPVTAPLVKEAYRMYRSGVGFKNISSYWNDQGAKTVRGGRWDKDTVRRVMDNEFYVGKFLYKPQPPKGQPEPKVIERVLLEGSWEPLLSEGEWLAYNAKRGERSGQAPRTKASDWAFAGFVLCSRCGASMTKNKSGKNVYLHCSRRRKGNGCEGVTGIWSEVNLSIWNWFGSHLEEWAASMPSADEESKAADLAVLNAQAAKDQAQGRISSLLSRMVTFNLTNEEVADTLAGLREELAAAVAVLDSALAVQASLVPASDVHEMISRGTEDMSTEEWRDAVGKALAGVVILPDRRVLVVPKGEKVKVW